MFQAALRYGIQKATTAEVMPEGTTNTVGEHIDHLLRETDDEQVAAQIRRALSTPNCIIEVRSGDTVQTATPDMPLRELLPQSAQEVEITVSQAHAGG